MISAKIAFEVTAVAVKLDRTRARWALLTAIALMPVAAGVGAQSTRPGKPASVEERLGRIERQLSAGGLFQLVRSLDELKRQVQEMRGEIEIQAHELRAVKQRQRELFIDFDRLAQRLEAGPDPAVAAGGPDDGAASPAGPPAAGASGAAAAAGVPPAAPAGQEQPAPAAGGVPPAPAAAPSETFTLEEQNAYTAAFALLKEGRYEKAAKAFKAFLERYGEGRYADNAQYWLAESHYVTRDFPASMAEFKALIERFPQSPKAPGAQLKIGFIHHELGQRESARQALTGVVERYPASTAARLARDRLKRLE